MTNSNIEYSVLDPDNPYSVINMCEGSLRRSILEIDPELFTLDYNEFKKKYAIPSVAMRLQESFYHEWQVCVAEGKKMSIKRICQGVCTVRLFDGRYTEPTRNSRYHELAWIVSPPENEASKMQEIINLGIDRMREIIQLPVVEQVPLRVAGKIIKDSDGKPRMKTTYNRAVMSEIRQIVQFLTDRLHGTSVQRHEIFEKRMSLNINANGSPKELAEKANVNDMSHEDIESQLADIDSKLLTDSTIDAEVTDDHHENSGTTQ